jgi:hypothetical protein
MSFFSVSFSSDSSQEVVLAPVIQPTGRLGGSETLELEGAPPPLGELEAMTESGSAALGLEGAPPPLGELEAMTESGSAALELAGTPPSFGELEAMTESGS